MFHKEDTALFGVVASNPNNKFIKGGVGGGGGKNKNNANPSANHSAAAHYNNNNASKKKSATMDVPLKKSVRKQLYQRACDYFRPNLPDVEELLKQVFLQGNLSSRSLPLAEKHRSMVVYVKTPSNGDNDNNGNDSIDSNASNVHKYPYKKSTQFVWMAMVDGKTKVVDESPTVALWAILSNCLGLLRFTTNGNHNHKSDDLQSSYNNSDHWHQWYVVQVPAAVSKFVCRGADLMKAGMRSIPNATRPASSENSNHKDGYSSQTVAIMVQGNPQPFAVGRLLLSKQDNNDDDKNNDAEFGYQTKGVGVEIWSTYGDDFWRQSAAPSNLHKGGMVNVLGGGDSFENGHFGNIGFSEGKFVYPLTNMDGQEEDDSDDEQEGNAESERANKAENQINAEDNKVTEVSAQEGENNATDKTAEGDDQVETNDEDDNKDEDTPESHLHQAVCQALVNLSNKDFPMLITTFYSKHVVPNSSQKIDLKQTKYKKFGAYIKEQVALGLLLVGPDKANKKNKDPMAMILGYYKKHDDVQGLTKSAPVLDADAPTRLVLVNLYVIQNSIVSLMRLDADEVAATNATSEERRGTGMLTTPEVKQIVEGYIEREELVHPVRKDQITLDGPLTDAIFPPKQQKQNPQPLPTIMKRKEVYQQFTARLQPAYALVTMPGSKITTLKKGTPPKVEIEVSMRQSRKFVTRIRGMEEYGIDGQVLSKDVSKRLACSSTVDTEAAAGRAALKKGRVEVEFQGNIADELEALLTGDESLSSHGGVKDSDYAIPLKVLEVILRKGVPPRKRKGGGKKKK